MRPGRTFTARMYSRAARVNELHYFTRLNKDPAVHFPLMARFKLLRQILGDVGPFIQTSDFNIAGPLNGYG